MKQFIKINQQDGLIYFDRFEDANLYCYPNHEGNLIVNVEIKSEYEPYTAEELNDLEHILNEKLNREIEFVWIELRSYQTSFQTIEEIFNSEIIIKRGYDIDEEEDSIAHAYFGWSIELNNNIIHFVKNERDIYIKWEAECNDIVYYDDRAEKCYMRLICKLNLIKFDTEKDYHAFLRKKLNIR